MEQFSTLKYELIRIGKDLSELINLCLNVPGTDNGSFKSWEATCSGIEKQLAVEKVRVAVAGTIKSGKSTFVNSLFNDDYLKRGAGVVTSIVTRIKCGSELKATLFFKPWDEINQDINQSLNLLPSVNKDSDEQFDLRKKLDRNKLKEIIDQLSSDELITNDSRNVNTVLLTSYIKGFDAIESIIQADVVKVEYKGNEFNLHRKFAGDEVLAVYLKDIELEIDSDIWEKSIEIADCQGSDSPNPLHLAMIQDYLQYTNFIVYVVSSRTGLRRADIKFLSIIKKMGIMDNIIFIINCDFSEHYNLDDLNKVVTKITEEISLIKTDPQIYPVSALYNLFAAQKENNIEDLDERDLFRLDQWTKESDFKNLTVNQTDLFKKNLNEKLTGDRYSLILKNHIERLLLISAGLEQWVELKKEIISRDKKSADAIINKIKVHQEKMNQVKSMIRNTLDGALKKVKIQIKTDTDKFFDDYSGKLIPELIEFIKNYNPSMEDYLKSSEDTGFSLALNALYTNFKQSIDKYMTEKVSPDIIGFVKESDKKLANELKTMSEPYSIMVKDAVEEYKSTIESLEINYPLGQTGEINMPDIEALKNISGLKPQPVAAIMKYSIAIRAEAVARLGIYKVLSFIKKAFTKKSTDPETEKNKDQIRALKDGLSRAKAETEKNIVAHFKSYKENIKFQYFYKLADSISNSLFEIYADSFQSYLTDLVNTSELLSEKKIDKDKFNAQMEKIKDKIDGLTNRLVTLRQKTIQNISDI